MSSSVMGALNEANQTLQDALESKKKQRQYLKHSNFV